MADACAFFMNLLDSEFQSLLMPRTALLNNIGCGGDLTIKEFVELRKKAVGFEGIVVLESDKLEGTPGKLLDVSAMTTFGWRAKTKFNEGLTKTYQDYLNSV
jgi:GDP-L-fucose synthase